MSDSDSRIDGGGAAWARVVALWFCCAGTLGLQYAFGALYVDLLVEFPEAGRGATAAVGGICVGVMDAGAIGAGLVMAKIGERRCCMLGAALTSAGLLASSYARTLAVLYLTWGVMVGGGMALSLFSGVVCVNRWFSSKRAVASGIGNTGAAVGPFLFGALWSAMSAEHGWRGNVRMLAAGDLLVLCGAAVFLTPPTAAPAQPSPQPQDDQPDKPNDGSLAAVWKLPQIRRLCLAIFLMGLGVWVPAVHLLQFARDRGFSALDAERLLFALAIGSTALRVPLTYVADKLGRKRVFTAVLLSYVCADIVLVVAADHYAVMLAYSLLVGGMIGCLLSLMPTLPADEVGAHEPFISDCSKSNLHTNLKSGPPGVMFPSVLSDAQSCMDCMCVGIGAPARARDDDCLLLAWLWHIGGPDARGGAVRRFRHIHILLPLRSSDVACGGHCAQRAGLPTCAGAGRGSETHTKPLATHTV